MWRPRQNGHHFPDDLFKCIFFDENLWTSINISLKFVPKGPINNIPALAQIKAWRWPGDKPLSEPVMVSLLTHICVTWPQWVKNSQTLCGMFPVLSTALITLSCHTQLSAGVHQAKRPLWPWQFCHGAILETMRLWWWGSLKWCYVGL